jgi:hypothetical protein
MPLSFPEDVMLKARIRQSALSPTPQKNRGELLAP